MRRSDRLFQIVNYLQGRKLAVTARHIAAELGVCERTVYRDMSDLVPARLALAHRSAETLERGEEEGLDVVGLEPARLGTLHRLPDAEDAAGVHGVLRQRLVVDLLFARCHRQQNATGVGRGAKGLVEGFCCPVPSETAPGVARRQDLSSGFSHCITQREQPQHSCRWQLF